MRKAEINVYTYNELSQSAKDKVKQWLNSDYEEISVLLKYELEETSFVNATLTYSLGCCQGDGVSFTGKWEGDELKAIFDEAYEGKVSQRISMIIPYLTLEIIRHHNNYSHKYTVETMLTMYNRDESANIVKLLSDAEKVIDAYRIKICIDLEKIGYEEIEYRNSDEYMEEACEANDYEFYENGEVY